MAEPTSWRRAPDQALPAGFEEGSDLDPGKVQGYPPGTGRGSPGQGGVSAQRTARSRGGGQAAGVGASSPAATITLSSGSPQIDGQSSWGQASRGHRVVARSCSGAGVALGLDGLAQSLLLLPRLGDHGRGQNLSGFRSRVITTCDHRAVVTTRVRYVEAGAQAPCVPTASQQVGPEEQKIQALLGGTLRVRSPGRRRTRLRQPAWRGGRAGRPRAAPAQLGTRLMGRRPDPGPSPGRVSIEASFPHHSTPNGMTAGIQYSHLQPKYGHQQMAPN